MPAQALLIDLDGVIRQWSRSDNSIEAQHGLPPGSIERIAFSPKLLLPAITGSISDEQWRERVAEELGKAYPAATSTLAVALWSLPAGELDQKTLSLLDLCDTSLRIVLVTNATSRLSRDLGSLGIAGRFHAVVNSSEVGAVKPSPAIFNAALQRADVSPEHALFVDDSGTNVDAAVSLGIRSHRYTGHSNLATFLKQEGVLREPAL